MTPEDLLLPVACALVAAATVTLWLLSRPRSWLSRAVDRAVVLPAVSR